MTPWIDDGDVRLYHGDNLDVLRQLPSGSVHMCATSPPFYGLRSYIADGHDDKHLEIGLEDTPDQWVERLVAVFREVRRVLRDDGTLWVEIGDSYSGSTMGGGSGANSTLVGSHHATRTGTDALKPPSRTGKPKDLLGQPWLLAKALRDPYYTGKITSEADRVWLAAMIDAEGCIAIHKRPAGTPNYAPYTRKDGTTANYERKNDSFQPKLEISNTNLALIERVIAITGEGNTKVKQEAGTHGRKQTIYRWTVTADKCRDLLREVYSHLVAKQHEARLAIGCPSSGDKATAAHEALKLLHGGSTTGIDFPAPGSMWEAGWYLRSEIIWSRLGPNPMPESVTDRPTKSHSTVFLLSKQPRYFYDADAIREPHQPATRGHDPHGARGDHYKIANDGHTNGEGSHPTAHDGHLGFHPSGANARSVWTIPTQPTPFAHFATWPEALCRRMILAGTSERGCCPECGAPWVRDVEKSESDYARILRETGTTWRDMQAAAAERGMGFDGPTRELIGGTRDENGKQVPYRAADRQTLGWSPSCWCTVDEFAASSRESGGQSAVARTTKKAGEGDGCHPATVPTPIPCTVLDPFAGSATTMLVARNHGRHSIGIELNEDYLQIAAKRLQQLSLLNT